MSWSTPSELSAQVQRLWDSGDLLRASVSPTLEWPLRLSLKSPSASDLTNRFEEVRSWVATRMADLPPIRLEWRESAHRIQGRQRLPAAAWVDTLDDALALLGKTRAAQAYRLLWRQTADRMPALLPWLTKRPLQALELADRWERLMAVVAWMQNHPRPGVYLRQVDAAGVHSKFIETHRGVLSEWLDLALPAQSVDFTATGVSQFNRRFGFVDKPLRIRFRWLDAALPSLPILPGVQGQPDITLDAASFASLELPLQRVYITENEINFLAFPPVARAIVVFGAGYGWDSMAPAKWLHQCQLHYWGDIDTHGFAILDQLRSRFAHTASLLMDVETLQAHRLLWGEEHEPVQHELVRLTPQESSLYDLLRFDRLQPKLRLEQERIGQRWLLHAITRTAP